MLSYLQAKYDAVLAQHHTHYQAALQLQATLRNEVLGRLVEERQLDRRSLSLAREWVDDYGSVLRMYNKHHFDPAKTLSALERTLRWRVLELAFLQVTEVVGEPSSERPFIHCLPNVVHDVFGRPVLLVQLGKLFDASVASKREIVRAYEEMRKRLRTDGSCREPTLQCVVIVDLKDVAMRRMVLELIPWFIREVAPRFPGMCAEVFVVNYSWAYGMYHVVKRLLPANILLRISFPSASEILSCFKSSTLPRDYGGDLDLSSAPPLHILEGASAQIQVEGPLELRQPDIHLPCFLPSMSTLNPYFGYPVMSIPGSSVPSLKNGRRRKRDLLRTLTLLWVTKLKKLTNKTWLWINLTVLLWALGLRATDFRIAMQGLSFT